MSWPWSCHWRHGSLPDDEASLPSLPSMNMVSLGSRYPAAWLLGHVCLLFIVILRRSAVLAGLCIALREAGMAALPEHGLCMGSTHRGKCIRLQLQWRCWAVNGGRPKFVSKAVSCSPEEKVIITRQSWHDENLFLFGRVNRAALSAILGELRWVRVRRGSSRLVKVSNELSLNYSFSSG
jgi:hypothetical protein